MDVVDADLENYSTAHTTPPPELLRTLQRDTHAGMEGAQMLTGTLEGRFLKMLVQISGAKRVLEIGMFTGYGTLSMAEGLPEDGEMITCELDTKRIAFARKYFEQSEHGKKIRVLEGPAVQSLKKLKLPFDLVFIDADKINYPHYYEESLRLLRSGGIIAIDNVLWSGQVLSPSDDDTRAIDQLNKKLVSDSRVETVLVTIRDGVQLVRKK